MLVAYYIMYKVVHELAVSLRAKRQPQLVGILLRGPDGPQRHVGLLHLCQESGLLLAFHEVVELLRGGVHGVLEIVNLSIDNAKPGSEMNVSLARHLNHG